MIDYGVGVSASALAVELFGVLSDPVGRGCGDESSESTLDGRREGESCMICRDFRKKEGL